MCTSSITEHVWANHNSATSIIHAVLERSECCVSHSIAASLWDEMIASLCEHPPASTSTVQVYVNYQRLYSYSGYSYTYAVRVNKQISKRTQRESNFLSSRSRSQLRLGKARRCRRSLSRTTPRPKVVSVSSAAVGGTTSWC